MTNRSVLALVAIFAVGITIGILGALALSDDDTADTTAPATIAQEDCGEAQDVVDDANQALEELGAETEIQDSSFFAAILVQQRTVTYAMEAAPSCFTLSERAGSEGLLMAITQLIGVTSAAEAAEISSGSGQAAPTVAPTAPADD